ncbi:MAG: hypothetical protein PHI18_09995 [bacterium]|nr:hypothetical protein [bacterium]
MAACGTAFAGAELFSFEAFAVVDRARIEWSTGGEQDVRSFVIERSGDGRMFSAIGQVAPTGSFSQYVFVDSSPLDADIEHTFYYRLRIVNRDGTASYSQIEEISLFFSAVQQTWGSIKAMFR